LGVSIFTVTGGYFPCFCCGDRPYAAPINWSGI